LSPATIATGARIDSYFVHFDSVGEPQNPVVVFGTITFDRDVLGIMVLQENLNLTHSDPGLPTTIYSLVGELEIVGGGAGSSTNDQITLSADRRTVSFNFRNTGGSDDCRIITAAVPNRDMDFIDDRGGGDCNRSEVPQEAVTATWPIAHIRPGRSLRRGRFVSQSNNSPLAAYLIL